MSLERDWEAREMHQALRACRGMFLDDSREDVPSRFDLIDEAEEDTDDPDE